jgi:hypothetical protein
MPIDNPALHPKIGEPRISLPLPNQMIALTVTSMGPISMFTFVWSWDGGKSWNFWEAFNGTQYPAGQVFTWGSSEQLWNDKLSKFGQTWRAIMPSMGGLVQNMLTAAWKNAVPNPNPPSTLDPDLPIAGPDAAEVQLPIAVQDFYGLNLDANGKPQLYIKGL